MNYAAEYVFPGHPDKLCDAIALCGYSAGWFE